MLNTPNSRKRARSRKKSFRDTDFKSPLRINVAGVPKLKPSTRTPSTRTSSTRTPTQSRRRLYKRRKKSSKTKIVSSRSSSTSSSSITGTSKFTGRMRLKHSDVSVDKHPRVLKIKEQIVKEYENIEEFKEQREELIRVKGRRICEIEQMEVNDENDIEEKKELLVKCVEKMENSEKRLSLVGDIVERIILVYIGMSKKMSEFDNKQDERIFFSNLESERVALRKQDPIEVLKKLQENLNVLLKWKEYFENELKNENNRRKTKEERKLEEMKFKMRELEKLTDQYRLEANDATREKNSALRTRKITIEESNRIMRKLQKDNERLMDTYKRERDTIKDLNKKLQARDKILRHREIQLMEITQLASQIRQMQSKHDSDSQQIMGEKNELSKEVEDKLKHYNKLEAERIDLEEDLKRKNEIIRSLKKDANRVKVVQLNRSIKEHDLKLKDIRGGIIDLRKLHSTLEKKVKILKDKDLNLVKEYRELTRKCERLKRKKEKKKARFLRKKVKELFKETEQKSSHVSSYYKMRLMDKKKEYDKLSARIQKMITANHRRTNVVRSRPGRKDYGIDLKGLAEKEKKIRELTDENRLLERQLREVANLKEMLLSRSRLQYDLNQRTR